MRRGCSALHTRSPLFSPFCIHEMTFFRKVSPAPLPVLTLNVKGCPRWADHPPSLPLAMTSCTLTDPRKLTGAHICLSSFWLGQTEPAPSPRNIGPSWSLSLCQLGSGNLCELLREGQEGELETSAEGGLHLFHPLESMVPTYNSSLGSHPDRGIYIHVEPT